MEERLLFDEAGMAPSARREWRRNRQQGVGSLQCLFGGQCPQLRRATMGQSPPRCAPLRQPGAGKGGVIRHVGRHIVRMTFYRGPVSHVAPLQGRPTAFQRASGGESYETMACPTEIVPG